jgi:hypothetical protein
MRIICLKCNDEFSWKGYIYDDHQLWFLTCLGCDALAIPPSPKQQSQQEILDTLLRNTVNQGGYYDPEKMKVLLD